MIRRDPTVIRVRPDDITDMQQLIDERIAAKRQAQTAELQKQYPSFAAHAQVAGGPVPPTPTPAPAQQQTHAPPDILALENERRRRQAMSTAQRLGLDPGDVYRTALGARSAVGMPDVFGERG